MRLLSVQACCPQELSQAVSQASSLGEAGLHIERPLAYHQDCYVTLQSFRPLGLKVAVKSYSKHRLSALSREQVDTEALIHSTLDHEHIVPLLLAAECDRCLHLVVRWADGGDLRQHIAGIGEQRLREFVVRPLLHALAVLDAKGVVHRDVKPDNVLVHQGQVQLADFGLAIYCHPQEQEPEESALEQEGEEQHQQQHSSGSHACDRHDQQQQQQQQHYLEGQVQGAPQLLPSTSPDSSGLALQLQLAPATTATSCDSSLAVSCRSSCSMLDTLAAGHHVAPHHQQAVVAPVLSLPPHAAKPPLHHHHQHQQDSHDEQHHQELHQHRSGPGPAQRSQMHHAATAPIPMAALEEEGRPASTSSPHGSGLSPGDSVVVSLRHASSAELMSSAGGTPLYTAPEVLRCMFESRPVDVVVTPRNDVWSLGIMVLEALSGQHPFSRSSNALHAIASLRTLPALPAHLSPTARAWLALAVNPDPALRPSAAQLLAHPWMQHTPSSAIGSAGGAPGAQALQLSGGGARAGASEESGARSEGGGADAAAPGLALGAGGVEVAPLQVVARGCKVQLQREGAGSLGGASPTAASAHFMNADSWEY